MFVDIDLYPIDYINIEGGYVSITTEFDSALASQLLQLKKTKNVFLAGFTSYPDTIHPLSEEKLDDIAYNCEFPVSRSQGSFEKYAFLWEDNQSIALKLYESNTGRIITKRGLFYFDGCKLCTNAKFIFIRDSVRMDCITRKLGTIILKYDEDDLEAEAKGKTIFVGSFDGSRDKHSTYNGNRYGPYLHYLGYRSLMDGNHIVRWWYVLTLVFIYTVIHYFAFSDWKEWAWLNKILSKAPTIRIIIKLLGYGLVLQIISFVLYQFDIYHSILVQFIWFSILSIAVKLKNNNI